MTLTDLKEAEKVIKGQQENKPEAEPEKDQEDTTKDNQPRARSSRTGDEGVRDLWVGKTAFVKSLLSMADSYSSETRSSPASQTDRKKRVTNGIFKRHWFKNIYIILLVTLLKRKKETSKYKSHNGNMVHKVHEQYYTINSLGPWTAVLYAPPDTLTDTPILAPLR